MASSDLSYIKGDLHHLTEVSIVLLGCRDSGERSEGSTILGQKVLGLQEIAHCLKRYGEVAGRKITMVEAPVWRSDESVVESTEFQKEELLCSVCMFPPGPYAVLVVVNGERIFTEKDREILAEYLDLLGDHVWSHIIVLFTFGDSVGDATKERRIESEGEALQWLVGKCGSRYVLKNKMDEDSWVVELLKKIEKMVEENRGSPLEMGVRKSPKVEDNRRGEEEENSKERRMDGMKYSPYFMNVCVYFFKFLQVFWFSSELESLPLWSITHLPRFRVNFPRVLHFFLTSQKHAAASNTPPARPSHDHALPTYRLHFQNRISHEDFREYGVTEKDTRSTYTLHHDAGQASAEIKLFTPDLVKNNHKDKNGDEYRFLCPGAGQYKCALTDLVFEMEGKGVVLYSIGLWESRVLNRLRQVEPAGPLYSIDCLEGSISHLHLPHCEIHWGKDVMKWTVADVTGDVEIIQPRKVTDTHAIVDIQPFSLVGLLKSLLFQGYPIRAQVLLFCIETGKQRMSKLYIHLLPGNVPVEEVRKHHNCNTYIETTSKCQLIPGKTYSPSCRTPERDYVSKPKDKTFDYEYGPNYHPTFEVLFDPDVDEFTLRLLDENDQDVWRPQKVFLTGTEATSPKMDSRSADLDVDEHQDKLIRLVSSSLLRTGDCIKGQLKGPRRNPELERNPDDIHVHKGVLRGLQSGLTYQKQTAEDMELFVPEIVENCAEDRNRGEYRFLCPHSGQFMCKLTNLVFEMEGKGEVLYRIVPWDTWVLDGISHKEPAGPLYSIECCKGSVRYLHLPHCETRTDVVGLTVAHVTDGNVEIIQPLKVTSTHAIIRIHGLSLFGFLKALFFQTYPIRAQVLLFYKRMSGKHRTSKLHIHLLPANVPVVEVKKQHGYNTYIGTSSRCQLTPGRTYELRCKTADLEHRPQPEDETFDREYGPNYHPTFEVVFRTEVEEVTLSLLDENAQVVWRPRLVLLTGTEDASTKMDAQPGADFVDRHRGILIQKVTSVMEIADCLEGRKMITREMYRNVEAKATSHEQMRELYKHLESGGRAAKAEFYQILKEKQPCLVMDLESGSAQA